MQAVRGSLPAVLVSFFFLAIAWRVWKPGVVLGHWGTALGLPLGFLGSYLAIHDWVFPYPPVQATHWLLYVGFAAGAVGLVESTGKVKPQVRYTLYVLLAAFVAWVFPAARPWRDEVHWRWVWTAIGFVYALFAGLATQRAAEKDQGPWLSVAWSVLTGAFAFACVQGGTGKLGQLVGALSAVLGVAAFVGFVHKRFTLQYGGVAVTAFLFTRSIHPHQHESLMHR